MTPCIRNYRLTKIPTSEPPKSDRAGKTHPTVAGWASSLRYDDVIHFQRPVNRYFISNNALKH